MATDHSNKHMLDFPAFMRLFEQRGPRIMWFLGAGASRAAGVKTAWDMTWDFKTRLCRSHRKLAASAVADLSDPRTRSFLQRFFDEQGGFPPANSEEEYAAYFEATYPSSVDRKTYLQEMLTDAKPSFGHLALAYLMKLQLCRAVWTTNFDRLIEDAAAQVFGTTSQLLTADLGDPERLRQAFAESRWPVYGKLHGDFHTDALKNTESELVAQDETMRRLLLNAGQSGGIAVVGYSGRDRSVMNVFNEAIDQGRGFPNGLFWFRRSAETPYPAVAELMDTARMAGVEAHSITVESFDELFSDLLGYLPQTETVAVKLRKESAPPRAKLRVPESAPRVPFIRTNALPIITYPKVCRLVDCEIDGWNEIQNAVTQAGSDILAARVRPGVIAFGDDDELRRVFGSFNIKDFGTHGILPDRLAVETGERTLLREALFRGIERQNGLNIARHGRRTVVKAVSTEPQVRRFTKLKSAVGLIAGTVPNTALPWQEECALRIDYRLDRLWLLLGPSVHVTLPDEPSEADKTAAKEFVRERLAKRYNHQANNVFDGWVHALFGDSRETITLRAIEASGIGAQFDISPVSGYSGVKR